MVKVCKVFMSNISFTDNCHKKISIDGFIKKKIPRKVKHCLFCAFTTALGTPQQQFYQVVMKF